MNLYAMVGNDPIRLIDILGLVEYKFEVVRGDPTSDASILGASGRWGQPWWCADGSYTISDALAYSTVTITSRDAGEEHATPWTSQNQRALFFCICGRKIALEHSMSK
ncbi:hypothetical protein [Fontisphaera persica]|uniref:hypothetical protein n=1 Tax=Fontisphaera persica TaxID=2974023 RepID=UPI003CCC8FC6